MLSLLVCPKVITLSGFYSTFFIHALNYLNVEEAEITPLFCLFVWDVCPPIHHHHHLMGWKKILVNNLKIQKHVVKNSNSEQKKCYISARICEVKKETTNSLKSALNLSKKWKNKVSFSSKKFSRMAARGAIYCYCYHFWSGPKWSH